MALRRQARSSGQPAHTRSDDHNRCHDGSVGVTRVGAMANPRDHGLELGDDPLDLRRDAPLLDGWLSYRDFGAVPFGTPGHKQRVDLVGPVVRDDIPLYGGVDTIRQTRGAIAEADRRLAKAWDADWGRISVGGST